MFEYMADVAPNVLERGLKLRALTTSSEPEEADSARRRLGEFLRKHNLTEDDLVEEATETASFMSELDGNQRVELARQVAKSRGCKTTVRRGGIAQSALRPDTLYSSQTGTWEYRFTGLPDAAKDARQLFSALVNICEGICELPPYGYYGSESDRFAWRTCFWLGFVASVQQKLDPERGGRLPDDAMSRIVSKGMEAPPDFLNRLVNGLLREHRPEEADQLRKMAYDAGYQYGNSAPALPYRGRRA